MPESQSETVALAVRAATQWMEAVTGRRFPPDRTFRAILEDGVLLCELMDNLNPGLLRHTPHLNNVERFIMGCKDLGMSKEQLFEETDLRDPNLPTQSRDKRKSLNERLKSICLTLFWLSQILDYSGPQLDLTPFTALFPDHQATVPKDGLTSEEEQTADQLLADIQTAVDEMLNDFQATNLSPDSTTPPSQPPPQTSSPAASLDKSTYHHYQVDADRESVVIEMRISGGGFGFQVRGGLDTVMNAQVDMVLPGSAAEKGGVKSGDEIISVNDRDVTGLRHADLVGAIRQAGSQGYISLGLLRVVEERPNNPLPPEEELMRQTAALKRMYPKSHQLLDSQMGSMLTPVQEEEFDLSPPLPPLPGELEEPLPPLPGESSTVQPPSGDNSTLPPLQPDPVNYISPLPPLPGEIGPSPLSPGVAAVVSVRDSIREMEDLQQSMEPSSPSPPLQLPPHPTSPSPPLQLPPHPTPPSPLPQLSPPPLEDVEEEGRELTSEELDAIVEDLGHASQSSERGEGEGEEQRVEKREEEDEGKVRDQPWEPKAQWEDNHMRVGESEKTGERKKVKIWSFLEEKTRISNKERAQAGGKHTPQQAPVFRKPPPPKVLPKPVRKKSVEQPPVGGAGGGVGGGGEEEVFIPSRDPNMITIQSTSSTEPLNVRPVMAEEVELHGDIKIQKVAHTRWTPQKKSPEQVQRSRSHPVMTPPTATPPKPVRKPTPQEERYGEGMPPGPVKQVSLPQFPPPRGGQQPKGSKGSRGQRLAEQTRVVNRGPPVGGSPQPPAAARGRVQSTGQQTANGGPSYDSLRNVARDIQQQSVQQAKARSQTWGPRERRQFTGQPATPARPTLATMMPDVQRQDGPQQAFLVRPADPNLPCSLCNRPLGPQPPLIAIPGLHLHFHPQCFVCPVCHTYLTPPRGQSSTTVMVRSMRPHCHYCTSNTQGVQATEC